MIVVGGDGFVFVVVVIVWKSGYLFGVIFVGIMNFFVCVIGLLFDVIVVFVVLV